MHPLEIPDFAGWTLGDLLVQRSHLEGILVVSAGQRDPDRAQMRAEHKAVCSEISQRAGSYRGE